MTAAHTDRANLATATPATYDDIVALPPELIGEILDGELHVEGLLGTIHALTLSNLGGMLGYSLRHRADPASPRWWLLDKPELHLGHHIIVPDLVGWRRERMPRIPDVPWFTLAPDWLCEIHSPATRRIDRHKKLRIYARERIPHVWLLDPRDRTLEVLRLGGEFYQIIDIHAGNDIVRAEPFDAVELALANLWDTGDAEGETPNPGNAP